MGNMWAGDADDNDKDMLVKTHFNNNDYGYSQAPFDDHTDNSEDKQIVDVTYREYVSENGAVYKGERKDGERDGYGTLIWPDGSSYSGSWKSNLFHGKGELRHTNGDIFCW